ncbi:hypothetical protein [Streptomyces sp. S1D4-20]|uniref:hypothetical protein n=1 Tax=Streptomyces sp. S1D4-20 TaxID=2594462 RepID=UPI0013DEEE35|nr:hypothetical protein [Streptomyces sp. S1D4-20]
MPGTRPNPTSAPTPGEHSPAAGAFRRARLDVMPAAPPAEGVTTLLRVLTTPPPSARS